MSRLPHISCCSRADGVFGNDKGDARGAIRHDAYRRPMVQLPQDPAEEQVTDLIRVLTSGPHAVIRPPDPVVGEPKVGRNDPCPCGSGKKYKKRCASEG